VVAEAAYATDAPPPAISAATSAAAAIRFDRFIVQSPVL
jgi:hypothetical protein